MKVTELKNKIVIAELDPEKDYIVLVDPNNVGMSSLRVARGKNDRLREIPVVIAHNLEKPVIQFIEVPKKKLDRKGLTVFETNVERRLSDYEWIPTKTGDAESVPARHVFARSSQMVLA